MLVKELAVHTDWLFKSIKRRQDQFVPKFIPVYVRLREILNVEKEKFK